jgi:hypothetical protein
MTKTLLLPLRLKLVRHQGQTVLNIEFESKALVDWCLALSLLKEGLISALKVREETGRSKLEIRVSDEAKERVRPRASFGPETTRLEIPTADLDYLLHFFLKYHRDGVAEVDHLDLELAAGKAGQDACITFKFTEAAQPVSSGEAKRRLGLQ